MHSDARRAVAARESAAALRSINSRNPLPGPLGPGPVQVPVPQHAQQAPVPQHAQQGAPQQLSSPVASKVAQLLGILGKRATPESSPTEADNTYGKRTKGELGIIVVLPIDQVQIFDALVAQLKAKERIIENLQAEAKRDHEQMEAYRDQLNQICMPIPL